MAAEAVQSVIKIDVRSEGATAVARELDKLVGSEEALARAIEQTTKIRESQAAASERLLTRLTAEGRERKIIGDLEKAIARDTDPERRARLQDELDRRLKATAKAMNDNATAAKSMTAAMGEFYQKQQASGSMIRTLDAWSKGTTEAKEKTELARHELINLGRQAQDIAVSLAGGQSPLTVLFQQGSQVYDVLGTHKGGIGNALTSLGEKLLGLVTPGRLLTAGLIGGFVGVEAAASRATSALADLGARSRSTGLSPTSIVGADIVGAGAGLDSKATQGALETARQQFEAYKRASGDVHDALEKVDKGFMSVADRARTAGEFIDAVQQKIRQLPREEALDLSQKLFGADAGAKLFENIRNGELSMRGLSEAAGQAGKLHDELATKAEAMQREIDKAAEIANSKMLVAFQALGNPVESLKMSWYGVVGAMADAIAKSQTLQGVMQGFLHPIDTLLSTPSRIGAMFAGDPQVFRRIVPVNDPFDAAKSAFFRAGPQIGPMQTAGESRKTYQAIEDAQKKGKTGKTEAEREQENYEKITKDLEQQIRLVSAVGDEHKKVQWEIEKENWLEKLGTDHSEAHKKRVGELAEQLYKAREAQEELNKSARAFNEAYTAVSHTVSGALKEIIKGGNPKDALKSTLDSLQGNVLDAALTGSGPLAKIFGVEGKDGAVGGLFGSIASAFGFGGKAVGQMNVNATSVVVNGGVGGAAGGAVEGLGKWLASLFKFEDGGIMTSRGPVPLRRYAGGGVASSPQLAMFGEGSVPEAYVPLPNGRSIPVEMSGGGRAHASPVTVNLIGAPQGTQVKEQTDSRGGRRIDIVIDERTAASLNSPQGVAAMRGYNARPSVARR